jgi:hypothetical protein
MKRSVYIGAEREQELAALVLQHTIEATASRPVEVFLLHRAIESAGAQIDNQVQSNTPFSKQRLFVPTLAGEGQAAYLDSDMLVFRDIHELFDAAGEHAVSSCRTRQPDREAQTSVLVFDVARCTWNPSRLISQIDADPAKYRPYLYEFSFIGGTERTLAAEWNDLEHYEPGSTRLLHFTDMETQPWLTSTNRHADVWLGALQKAVAARPEVAGRLRAAIERFEVRPSLGWQARHGWASCAAIPPLQRLLDVFQYVPPHALVQGLPGRWGTRVARLLAGPAPAIVKRPVVFLACVLLLARRRRRLLVRATLSNRKCVINRNVQATVS